MRRWLFNTSLPVNQIQVLHSAQTARAKKYHFRDREKKWSIESKQILYECDLVRGRTVQEQIKNRIKCTSQSEEANLENNEEIVVCEPQTGDATACDCEEEKETEESHIEPLVQFQLSKVEHIEFFGS